MNKPNKLVLTINIGNDDVQTRDDVARVIKQHLTKIANKDSGKIMDDNGNSIGKWEYQ
jgi:hypothetical protein